jgi:hypothetical protein
MTYRELLKEYIGEDCWLNINHSECSIRFGFKNGAFALKEVGEDFVIFENTAGPFTKHVFLVDNTSIEFFNYNAK